MMKKSLAFLALTLAATLAFGGAAMAEEEEFYPGGSVVYRDGDPEADIDVEITSEDDIQWVVGCLLQETNPQTQAMREIGKELEEKTNGHFTFDIYVNGELGSEGEMLEMVRNNTVQLTTSNTTTVSMYVDTFGVFALPYVFHSEQDELKFLSTNPVMFDLLKQLEEASGLVAVGFNCTGARCLSTKGVDRITGPADLAGVKVRSMEAQASQDLIASLGATPVPIAYTELYTALQTGVVQGQDNPLANTVDGRFYEVLDTIYRNDHTYNCSAYYSNTEAWDALPDDYKALLEGLFEKYLGQFYHDGITAFTEECIKTMEDAGLTIVPQEELDMDAFYASAEEMINEKYMSNEAFANIINAVKEQFNY